MPPMLQLNELNQLKKKKDNIKKVSYDKIIELSHRRIKNIASFGGQNTFFEIPGMLFGYPLYDMHDCFNYVVDALRKNGLFVQILPPPHICVMYISWSPNDLNPKITNNMNKPPKTFEMPKRIPSSTAQPMTTAGKKKLQYTF